MNLLAHRLTRDIDDPHICDTTLVWETREAMEAYWNPTDVATRVAPLRPFFAAAFVVNRRDVVIEETFG